MTTDEMQEMMGGFIKTMLENLDCYSWQFKPEYGDSTQGYLANVYDHTGKPFSIKITHADITLSFKGKSFMCGFHNGEIFDFVQEFAINQKEKMNISLFNQLKVACEQLHKDKK